LERLLELPRLAAEEYSNVRDWRRQVFGFQSRLCRRMWGGALPRRSNSSELGAAPLDRAAPLGQARTRGAARADSGVNGGAEPRLTSGGTAAHRIRRQSRSSGPDRLRSKWQLRASMCI